MIALTAHTGPVSGAMMIPYIASAVILLACGGLVVKKRSQCALVAFGFACAVPVILGILHSAFVLVRVSAIVAAQQRSELYMLSAGLADGFVPVFWGSAISLGGVLMGIGLSAICEQGSNKADAENPRIRSGL